MRIYDLNPDQSISILVKLGDNSLTFFSKILEVYPDKKMILAEGIVMDGKPVSFRSDNLSVSLLADVSQDKPLLFRGIRSKLFKKKNEYFYVMACNNEGLPYNRRESFRCYVGLNGTVQCGPRHQNRTAIIRDVSHTGFAIVCEKDLVPNEPVHAVLNDKISPDLKQYSIHMIGTIARTQELENGKILYGCHLTNTISDLDKYIMEKERLRLKNKSGSNL